MPRQNNLAYLIQNNYLKYAYISHKIILILKLIKIILFSITLTGILINLKHINQSSKRIG